MAERRRWHRFARDPDAPLNLTDRDMRVLGLLAVCRFVDTSQFQRLFGERIERRLTRLYRHGFVERPIVQKIWVKIERGGTRPLVYALTNKGAEAIGRTDRNWDALNRRLSRFSFSIPHTLLATDVVVEVLRAFPEAEVLEGAVLEHGGKRVVPDAGVAIGDVALLVEADRATEPIYRTTAKNTLQSLRGKFEAYHAALRGKGHEAWGVRRVRVLVVTLGGERRARHIAHAAGEGERILTTTRERLKASESPLSEPIWFTPDGREVPVFSADEARRLARAL